MNQEVNSTRLIRRLRRNPEQVYLGEANGQQIQYHWRQERDQIIGQLFGWRNQRLLALNENIVLAAAGLSSDQLDTISAGRGCTEMLTQEQYQEVWRR